ncbi:acetoin utilization protein AcuB [Cytobacillus eiseniae]|uniref:Acetoin utilization protein AcuB n=1 Tax=Cytobacillus eiseniae TaxID=762947 RepID=A0ABS4RFB0_9BACI|nr:acetoin utilization protein AcuB [Cytobacillus eiseniae]
MIVEEIMNTTITTLSENNSIAEAIQVMDEKKIRHLPIIDQNQQLIGLVTDRDIRDATPSIFETEELKQELQNPLKMIMKTDVITGHPHDFVEEISAILYEHRIGCLPIINHNRLVGIVTETDLLRTLVELTGAHQPGSQIEVRVPNRTGMLHEISTVIRNKNANIQSVLVYPDKKDEKYKIIVIRLQTMNPLALIEDLKKSGHHVLWPNHPGMPS